MPRKEKKFHFIYKTTNMLSGKYYIGMHSTDNLDDGYLGSGKRLRYSVNKYGKDNHSREILEFLDSRKELKEREEEIVNLNEIAKVECMNLQPGGGGGLIDNNHKEKWQNALHEGLKEKWKDSDFMENHKKRSSETFKKLHREGKIKPHDWTGRSHTFESKEKIRSSMFNKQSGSKNSQFGTCWIYNLDIRISKKIKKEELESFLNVGWIKGRKTFN